MTNPKDPIRINDKEFKFDDLPLVAQKDIIAIQGIDNTLNGMSSQMDVIQMARQGYVTRLNITIGEYENAKETDAEERRVQEIQNA